MEIFFENILNDDLKNKIYSMIIYQQPNELLTQIKLYQDKKNILIYFINILQIIGLIVILMV